jgi:hypothetical protein
MGCHYIRSPMRTRTRRCVKPIIFVVHQYGCWYITNVEQIKCWTKSEAESLVKHCLESGRIVPTKHFRVELANEGMTIQDAQYLLKHGHIYREPEPDIKTGEWIYRMEGKTLEAAKLAIVFCFKVDETCFLITVFSL